jgi:hypothetical protein
MFSLQQNWRKGPNRFCLEARGAWGRKRWHGRRDDPLYTHMNKQEKIKKEWVL